MQQEGENKMPSIISFGCGQLSAASELTRLADIRLLDRYLYLVICKPPGNATAMTPLNRVQEPQASNA